MADGFVRLYSTGWSPVRAALRIASLEVAGVGLVNPNTKQIHGDEYTDETCTALAAVDEDELMRALALADPERERVTVKFWFPDGADLVWSVSRGVHGVVIEEFDLDGFGGPSYQLGQDVVIRMVLDEMDRTGADVVGLVVDRWGGSLEMDLDDAVITGVTPVTEQPELLVLRPGVAELHPELKERDWQVRLHGEFVAFDRNGILDRR